MPLSYGLLSRNPETLMREIYVKYVKRGLDLMLALLLMVMTAPVMLVLVVWLHFTNEGAGVFFVQERPGKDERIIKLLKLKTMTDKRDGDGELLPDEERLTNVGRLIRKLSLDELPQLVNIVKGDMSFIGPRPLVTWYLPLYSQEQHRRHEVMPGISGWAQVHGRNDMTWQQKFKYDVWYVDNISFMVDVKVFFMTIWRVFEREGIDVDEDFNGHN